MNGADERISPLFYVSFPKLPVFLSLLDDRIPIEMIPWPAPPSFQNIDSCLRGTHLSLYTERRGCIEAVGFFERETKPSQGQVVVMKEKGGKTHTKSVAVTFDDDVAAHIFDKNQARSD